MKQRQLLSKLLRITSSRTGVLGLATVGNLVVRTGNSMVLTRLLTPRDYGIIGIITAIFFAVAMISDLGFEAFLIRDPRSDDPHFRNVIWTIHATRGMALFVAIGVSSPLLAWAFGKPVIALPLAAASVTFLLNGLASLSLMTALRRDKARELTLFDFGLGLFTIVVCLLLALWWHNAWAVIAAMVLQATLRTILSYTAFRDAAQRPGRDRAISREFLAFSRMVLMSSMLTLLIGQIDKLVLGRLFTLAEFGLYSIAVTIASAPTSFVQSYLRRIAFPVYANVVRVAPAEISKTYYGVMRIPSRLYAFCCGGLIGTAPLLVAILYDRRYAAASSFISLLMISSALRLPTVAAGELLIATGEMKRMVALSVVRVLWLSLAMPAGFFFLGTLGIVAAVGFVEVPAMLCCWILLRRRNVLDIRKEVAFIGLIAVGALSGFILTTAASRWLPDLHSRMSISKAELTKLADPKIKSPNQK